jgi:hypothetical protein
VTDFKRIHALEDKVAELQAEVGRLRGHLSSIADSEPIPNDRGAWEFCVAEARAGLNLT